MFDILYRVIEWMMDALGVVLNAVVRLERTVDEALHPWAHIHEGFDWAFNGHYYQTLSYQIETVFNLAIPQQAGLESDD